MAGEGRRGRRASAGVSGAGAAVAAGTVAVLAAVALALRPAHDLLRSGTGPLGHSGPPTIALVAVWTAAAVLVARRLRHRIGADQDGLPPREERLRVALLPLLLAGPVALGALALKLHHFGDEPAGPPPALPSAPGGAGPSAPPEPPSGDASGPGSLQPLVIALVVLAVLALVLVTVVVVRRLRRLRLTVPAQAGPEAPQDDEREVLLSAVRSGRRALADGADARAAVIACYAAMEEALAASGVDRRASDSPADLLARATRAGRTPGPAAPALTALFREARYSSHPMDDSRRDAAAAALEEIAAGLQEAVR